MKLAANLLLLSALLAAPSYAAEAQHKTPNDKQSVQALPNELRWALRKEMKLLERGMTTIIPAYIAGNWGEIESVAKAMKQSDLLNQNLSKEQLAQLHATLPATFLEKDKNFHYLAGMLEHAAKNKKEELVNFYFYKMNEACLNCHSQYAQHEFPELAKAAKEKKSEKHQH